MGSSLLLAVWFFLFRCHQFIYLFIYFFICSEFCHTLKWNSHRFTCVPPSRINLFFKSLLSSPDLSGFKNHPGILLLGIYLMKILTLTVFLTWCLKEVITEVIEYKKILYFLTYLSNQVSCKKLLLFCI